MRAMKQLRKQFKPARRKHGGFGHAGAKYAKNPQIQHARALEGLRDARRRAPIQNPSATVSDAVASWMRMWRP